MPKKFPILLLEDDPATVDIIQRVAQKVFPEAVLVATASFEQAQGYLYNLDGLGPKLALVDINLGGGRTGLDFLGIMKEHELGRLVPIIIVSASHSSQDMQKAYQLGAASYVDKPDSLTGWQNFMRVLRTYWYETSRLPDSYFERQKKS